MPSKTLWFKKTFLPKVKFTPFRMNSWNYFKLFSLNLLKTIKVYLLEPTKLKNLLKIIPKVIKSPLNKILLLSLIMPLLEILLPKNLIMENSRTLKKKDFLLKIAKFSLINISLKMNE
jgi:hypothetical protein